MKFILPRVLLLVAVLVLLNLPAQAKEGQSPSDAPAELKVQPGPSDKRPKPLKRVEPFYPFVMARAGLIGSVKVEFIINREGNVSEAHVVESNNPWFERPAIDAILEWKFSPGEQHGHTVNVRASQLIEFNLFSEGRTPELWKISKGKDHAKLPPELRWDTPPMPANTLFPVYPFEQLKAKIEGSAKISYLVGPDGQVVRSQLREATTPEFGAAVLAMIDAWHFHPAKARDGTPCYANLGGEYSFKANGRGDVPVNDEATRILSDLTKKPESFSTGNDLDSPLKALSRRSPVYPTALSKANQPGQAVIEFFVDKKGDAQLPRVVSSSAPEFGYAAVQAVATWRFTAPKRKHKAVVVKVRIPIAFNPIAAR